MLGSVPPSRYPELHTVLQTGSVIHASTLSCADFPLPGTGSCLSPGRPGYFLLLCEDSAEASPPESFPDSAPIPAGLRVPASMSCRAALVNSSVMAMLICESPEISLTVSLAYCWVPSTVPGVYRMWAGGQSCSAREARCQMWARVCCSHSFSHLSSGRRGHQVKEEKGEQLGWRKSREGDLSCLLGGQVLALGV